MEDSSSIEEVLEDDSGFMSDSRDELTKMEEENKKLRNENEALRKKLESYRSLLTFTKNFTDNDNMDEEEILPWSYVVDKLQRRKLASPNIDEHTLVFKKFLFGFAFCTNMSKNRWIWYDWIQKLWVFSSGEEMLPLLIKLITELNLRKIKLHECLLGDSNHLYSIIRNLKIYLPDNIGIQSKLNQYEMLIPMTRQAVLDIETRSIRLRRKEDYFTFFYDRGRIKGATKVFGDNPLRKDHFPDELTRFFNDIVEPSCIDDSRTPCPALYEIYEDWSREKDLQVVSRQKFGKFLQNRGFKKKKFTDAVYWLGIDMPLF